MTTEAQKTALLQEFQNYLEEQQPDPFGNEEQPDLHTLLGELTGLKTEVKAESRQFKNTLDTLASALETVQTDNKALSSELSASLQRYEQQQTEVMRAMLIQLIDLYDRLASGIGVLQNYQPVNALFKHTQKKDIRFIEQFKAGQLMTIKRFDQLLHSYQVRQVDCVGKPFDPFFMSAIEIEHKPKLENGLVTEELRKGFMHKDQVLRLAEVKVNKIQAY